MRSIFERLASRCQAWLPQHLLTAFVHRLMRVRSKPVKNAQIRLIARLAGVDWNEAASADLDDYPTFNAFFTRALKPGVRPIDPDPGSLCSPCDGRVSEIGRIDGNQLFQAKGHQYSLGQLLANDPDCAAWETGTFFTLYLSPSDYHRVHMPIEGVLQRMSYVPGDLFSVAPYTVRHVDGLFARNERVISIFDTQAGPVALVLVGAMLVAGMETVWAGEVTPAKRREITTEHYEQPGLQLQKGAEMGRFNMGSTVVLLLPAGTVESVSELGPGDAVRLGQVIARLRISNEGGNAHP
ncbi:MAG: phosphatidylserine decarboxylase [Xanthomonadales bacterium]|nr:phosphatidylserine decarboxylase [Xanthomonadales bacterium]